MNFDLLPTLARWTGMAVPSVQLDGADIASLLTIRNAPSPHDQLILFNNEDVAAIRTQRWKYVVRSYYRTYEAPLDTIGRPDWTVLVDMANDPAESYDVSARHPDILADMERRVANARATFDPLRTPKPAPPA
jgi:arylsulfatase A-like enzyme